MFGKQQVHLKPIIVLCRPSYNVPYFLAAYNTSGYGHLKVCDGLILRLASVLAQDGLSLIRLDLGLFTFPAALNSVCFCVLTSPMRCPCVFAGDVACKGP